jgi:hypothetical protein
LIDIITQVERILEFPVSHFLLEGEKLEKGEDFKSLPEKTLVSVYEQIDKEEICISYNGC